MFKKLIHKVKVYIRWIGLRINALVRFLTHDIWFLKEEDFSRWKGILVKDAKTVVLMVNTFSDQKIGYQVNALSFRSILAVVPAIAIGIYLTDGFGLKEMFSEILLTNLGDEPLTKVLMKSANNIVDTAQSGLFGFISMASFVWIVLSLMVTVRQVFNNVWKVEKENNILKLIGIIIGITILAPFVVIIFFSGSVLYSHVLDLIFPSELSFTDDLKTFATWLMFAGVTVLVISAMYKFIPGIRVRYRHAIKAALISGLVFAGIQYLYLETQVMVAKQSAVYGVLAALPLFMIWINLGWTIILWGAELSYAFQNVDKHRLTIEKLDKMNVEAIQKRKERLQKGIEI